MNKFWLYFLKNKALTGFLLMFLSIYGLYSIYAIPKESTPEVNIPVFVVNTIYPGASSSEIESKVSRPIEEKLYAKLKDIKRITSHSKEGYSSILVELLENADISESSNLLRDAVNLAKAQLPEDAKDPEIINIDFGATPVVSLAISSDLSSEYLYKNAEMLQDELEQIKGVSSVKLEGIANREIKVILDKNTIHKYGLSVIDIARQIQSNNISLPVGNIKSSNKSTPVRYNSQNANVVDLGDVEIILKDGSVVTLSDLASIKDTREDLKEYAETCSESCISDALPARRSVNMHIFKNEGVKITDVADAVYKKLKETTRDKSLEVTTIFDRAKLLKEDLSTLTFSGLQTMILIFIVLGLSVGFKEALIASISVPLSFIIAFVGLYHSDSTLNFVSLFALVLSMGIIVDSAIVILEGGNLYRNEENSSGEAIKKSILNFSIPMISGTMTTIVVFLPILLVSGVVGKFITSIPTTVSFVLTSSIFVSLIFVPFMFVIYDRIKLNVQPKYSRTLQTYRHKVFAFLEKIYEHNLSKLLSYPKKRKIFYTSIIFLFIISVALPVTGLMKIVFFGSENNDYVYIDLQTPPGSSLEYTYIKSKEVESRLEKYNPYFKHYILSVGSNSAFSDPWGMVFKEETRSNFLIELKKERPNTEKLINLLRKDMGNISGIESIKIDQQKKGAPSLAPITITAYSDSFKDLNIAKKEIIKILTDIPALTDIEVRGAPEGVEIEITPKPGLQRQNLTGATLALELNARVSGTNAGNLDNDDKTDINVYTRFSNNTTATNEVDDLQDFMNQDIYGLPLNSITNTKYTEKYPDILRQKNKRAYQILANVASGSNVREITKIVKAKIYENKNIPESVTFNFEGENADIEQSFKDLMISFVIGTLAMFAILLVQFASFRDSFVTLVTIPLSLVGIFFGFFITQIPFSFPAMMGLTALAGIVVNNAIILIDTIHKYKNTKSMSAEEVLILAGKRRLRPIILTSITTIIGVVPLLMSAGIWTPFALSIMFGLGVSTIFTLFVIPLLMLRSLK